jgi:hypothetical protein
MSVQKAFEPECPLCCLEACCDHGASEYGHCSDCYDTGHTHEQCAPCPNCTDSPGDSVGHIPADDIACSVCGFDIEDAALLQSEVGV